MGRRHVAGALLRILRLISLSRRWAEFEKWCHLMEKGPAPQRCRAHNVSWSGRRESNPPHQLGRVEILSSSSSTSYYTDVLPWTMKTLAPEIQSLYYPAKVIFPISFPLIFPIYLGPCDSQHRCQALRGCSISSYPRLLSLLSSWRYDVYYS